jgi:hypothetical protein
MSMSEIKREARLAMHAEMAEPCTYEDRGTPITPTVEQSAVGLSLSVRYKTKLKAASAEADGVSILENIESIIFSSEQLTALGLEPVHGAIITLPGYGLAFELDQPMDSDGPINVYWTVVRAL